MWLAVVYCTFFNSHFLSKYLTEPFSWGILLKFIFPLIHLITFDLSWLQLYMFFW